MSQDLRAAYRILSLLEKSKSLSDRIFDALPGVYLVVDARGDILRANQGAARLLDVDIEDVPGRNVRSLVDGSGAEVLMEEIEKLSEGRVERAEFELPVNDSLGQIRPFHWEVNRLPSEKEGTAALMSLIGRDVSELRKALREVFALEKDLDFARAAQGLVLPPLDSERTTDWAMAAHYEPAAQAGGDWWRYEKRSDGSALFLLGDVTGHGAGAGMVTAMVAGGYQAFTALQGTRDVKAILREIHRQLTNLRGQSYWMTLFAMDVQPASGQVKWYCAAAPNAMLVKSDGTFSELGGPGRPLGSGEFEVAEGCVPFEPGDRLLCTTDGLLEVSPDISAMMLKRRYLKALQMEPECPVRSRERLKEEWASWAKGGALSDDVAFLIIDRLRPLSNSQTSSVE